MEIVLPVLKIIHVITSLAKPGPEVIKFISMLNITEHEIDPALKCKNANNVVILS